MRAYFRHRRRSFLARASAITAHFLFWLPVLLFRMVARRGSTGRRAVSQQANLDHEFESRTEGLLTCYVSLNKRQQVREILERYAALHASLSDDQLRGSGQFELFAISGNGNGSTGTSCLFRNNLSKLKEHKLRTVNDLIRLVAQNDDPSSALAISRLAGFFDAFGDSDAKERIGDLRSPSGTGESQTVRFAA